MFSKLFLMNELSKHFCHLEGVISKTSILLQEVSKEKEVDLSVCFLHTKIKRSQDLKTADSNRWFECSKMQLFESICESSHYRGKDWSIFSGWFSRFIGEQLANGNFYWIWLIMKYPYITCHDVFGSTAIVFFRISCDSTLFWAIHK